MGFSLQGSPLAFLSSPLAEGFRHKKEDTVPHALVLFSGGLDSILAVRILQQQGITVTGLNIVTPFHCSDQDAYRWAQELQFPMLVRSLKDDYMAMLKKPKWGYGKGVNPCIDCRTMMLSTAREVMQEIGADFVATGEVVGQRPHSQMMHQLSLITRESGLGNRLLRPLSAKVLPPTEPEEKGLVNRDRLFSCTGRGRSGLIALAKSRFGVKKIPQPSTGCLLCEQSFSPRVRDILTHALAPTAWDAEILPYGRHLRINPNWKAVAGRRLSDCEALVRLFNEENRTPSVLLIPDNFNGPAVLLVNDGEREEITPELQRLAGGILLRFVNSKKLPPSPEKPIAFYFTDPDVSTRMTLEPDLRAESLPMVEDRRCHRTPEASAEKSPLKEQFIDIDRKIKEQL